MLASEPHVLQSSMRASNGCGSDASRQYPDEQVAKAITCFTPGTAITTLRGKCPVENLKQGDKVLTRDRGFQPLIWTGRRKLTSASLDWAPDLQPVRIKTHSLGRGLPDRDVIVSPKHRILTTDKGLLASVGDTEGLIEARALLGTPGIETLPVRHLTYIHLLFEQHELILSDNMWSESFHLCKSTINLLLTCQHAGLHALLNGMRATESTNHAQPLARKCVTVDSLDDIAVLQ